MSPFAPAQYIHRKYLNLGAVASYEDGDLVNLAFKPYKDAIRKGEVQVTKTLGYSQYNTNASLPGAKAGLGIGSFSPSTGSYGYVYAAWDNGTPDTQVYSLRSAGADPTSEGATARFVTNGNNVEFEQANDTLYITNGVDAVIKRVAAGTWSALSSGEPLSGSGTVAKYLSWHNFMMFAARTVNEPNKLNVSASGTPETFASNTKTFPYAIVGMKPMGNYQVIYTEKSIHLVSGFEPSQLAFQEVINPHPCVSHRSIVQHKGNNDEPKHIYLGADYVWMFNGSAFRKLGEQSWDNIRPNLNTARLGQAAAWYDPTNDQYRISVCTGAGTTNDTTYAYDFTSNRWVKLPYRSVAAVTSHGSVSPSTYWQDAGTSGIVAKENDGNNLTLPKTLINDGDGITATDTTFTVDSTTGFPSTGKFVCGTETIRYTGLTATEFTGCVRASDGTTATTHANNDPVYPAHQFKYSTVFLDEGEKNLFKRYKRGWVDAKSSGSSYSIMVNYDVDQYGSATAKSIGLQTSGAVWNSDSSFVWGGFTFGSSGVVQYPDQRFSLPGKGRQIKLSFEENTNIALTEIYSFEYKIRLLKKR